MSLEGLNPSPLNIDAEYPAEIRRKLGEIMAPGPYLADEIALIDLRDNVADALHTGRIDFDGHDALLTEIDRERDKIR